MININLNGLQDQIMDFELEIYTGKQLVQKQHLQGIGAMIGMQFEDLCRQMKASGQPMYAKIWRYEDIYDERFKESNKIKIGLQYWTYDVDASDMEEL